MSRSSLITKMCFVGSASTCIRHLIHPCLKEECCLRMSIYPQSQPRAPQSKLNVNTVVRFCAAYSSRCPIHFCWIKDDPTQDWSIQVQLNINIGKALENGTSGKSMHCNLIKRLSTKTRNIGRVERPVSCSIQHRSVSGLMPKCYSQGGFGKSVTSEHMHTGW